MTEPTFCPTCGRPVDILPIVTEFIDENATFDPDASVRVGRLLPAFTAWAMLNERQRPPAVTDGALREQLVTALVTRGAHHNRKTGHLEGVQL